MTFYPWQKRELTIALIGETGTGKTAFLDLLSNVCAGVQLKAFGTVHQTANEAGGKQSGSQTNKPLMYTITAANDTVIHILDTPGLADTRGIDKDSDHREAIANFIRDHTETIDAVIILANGTLPRLGVSTDYALSAISGLFPYTLFDNIGFVFTNVNDPLNFNFDSTSLPAVLQGCRQFLIDNPLARWLKYQAKRVQGPRQRLEKMRRDVEEGYVESLETLNDVFQWLDSRSVQPTKTINDLQEISTEIEAAIANVIASISQTEELRSALIKLQDDMRQQVEVPATGVRLYSAIVSRTYFEHEATNVHNTLCAATGCYSNCHLSCNVTFTLDTDRLGKQCMAFQQPGGRQDPSHCHVCGHSSDLHQHIYAKWVKKTKKVEEVNELAKALYDGAKTEAEKIEAVRATVEAKIAECEEALKGSEGKLGYLCDSYNSLALSGSFTGHVAGTIKLLQLRLEAMKDEGISQDAQNRMAERIRTLQNKYQIIQDAERKRRGVRRVGTTDSPSRSLRGV
ncbi:hypothetical protein GLOTRDRAFT_50300 [Gloeophyllum trabeum ATCC 11539]|uniref:G domain-containing protein n=1 Tax=Gloeophyllum trabeum (strain ATCC 11539 / FP-39264 / Madison 617) TaxID=670483 RepID=S7RE30_GLOTA|nr:uncharacterized protein GLOTRDRAFT_50300 [Gloeophyllum trabeum ATCC 11539]EPQ50714.1 hypothetical protein GLOTRDRAFT_50300 [Gloeophyllum trabeum ATCC 11539]